MKSTNVSVPAAVCTIIIKMGTLAHPIIPTLTAEEVTAAEAARKAGRERIKAEHGYFTNAVRDDHWDDGVQVVKGESLFTGGLPEQLFALGFNLVDAYATVTMKDGVSKPMTTLICSTEGDLSPRITEEVAVAVETMLMRNWFKAYIWLNARKEVPNMTINLFGNLKDGGAARQLTLTL